MNAFATVNCAATFSVQTSKPATNAMVAYDSSAWLHVSVAGRLTNIVRRCRTNSKSDSDHFLPFTGCITELRMLFKRASSLSSFFLFDAYSFGNKPTKRAQCRSMILKRCTRSVYAKGVGDGSSSCSRLVTQMVRTSAGTPFRHHTRQLQLHAVVHHGGIWLASAGVVRPRG